jgi:iron(III) transport system permease protein
MNKQKKNINIGSLLVKVALIYLIVAFILYPNINLLISVFLKDGHFSTSAFHKIIKSSRALKSMSNSFILAVSMVLTVNIVGVLVVLLTDYWKIKGATFLRLSYMSTLVYGGVTLVTGYKFVYGSDGILTKFLVKILPNLNPEWFTGYWAVIFIMTFACTSNHVIFFSNAIKGLDGHVIEAAKNMGAKGSTIFFKIVMPTLKPTLFAITILTFLTGLSAMSAPLIVGGTSFQTINPMIITFAKSPYSRELAALLAVFLGCSTVILLMIMNRVERGGNYISVSKTKIKLEKQEITNPIANLLAHIIGYFMSIIYLIPILLVIIFSFCDSVSIKTGNITLSSFTLYNYIRFFTQSNSFKPYLVSIIYSLLAAVIVAIISIVVARIVVKSKSKWNIFFEYSVITPWLLPGTFVALGLMMTYDTPRWIINNNVLIGTLVIMLIAYVVVKLPFTYRMIKAAFYGVDDNLEEAAKCMGSGTLRTMLQVILPVIMPAVASVIVLNFNSLLSDYDLSVFLYHPLYQPLGIVMKAASDETATVNAQSMSFVYAVVLMIISALALYFTQREKKGNK